MMGEEWRLNEGDGRADEDSLSWSFNASPAALSSFLGASDQLRAVTATPVIVARSILAFVLVSIIRIVV